MCFIWDFGAGVLVESACVRLNWVLVLLGGVAPAGHVRIGACAPAGHHLNMSHRRARHSRAQLSCKQRIIDSEMSISIHQLSHTPQS